MRTARTVMARLGLVLLAPLVGLACASGPALNVAITSPSDGDGVRGMVSLTATAEPTDAVSQVDFVVNEVSVGTVTSAPYTLAWDSTSFVGQTVTVTARARSASGSLGLSHPIQLKVSALAPALTKGKESMYRLVNAGNKTSADELLQDEWDFGLRSTPYYMSPVSWTADPYQDSYWRFIFYSLRPTSNLLWAYYTTGNTAYRDKLVEILSSYVAYDQTRAPDPDTFDDNYTAAFRAMVLVNSYWKLKSSGDLSASLDADLQTSIAKVAGALAGPVVDGRSNGLFSSDYSGLFTAAGALLLVAENFPSFDQSASWKKAGLERLNNSTIEAIDGQGVEIEDSPFYHFYLMTFGQEIAAWAAQWDVPLRSDYPQTIDGMADYATYILRPDGTIPLLAASVAMNVAGLDPDVEAHLTATDPGFAYVVSRGDAGVPPSARSRLFTTSGQSILRSALEPGDAFEHQSFVTFNVGQYRNRQNHLDVLGLTYFSAGSSLLTDSGLFTYDTSSPYQAYFYGTSAHNTVVVDGQDQSTAQGLVTQGLTASGPDWAYQSGSHALYAGVSYQRAVLLLQQDLLLVVDRLTSTSSHDYVQSWHLAPELTPDPPSEPAAGVLTASDASGTVLALVQGRGPLLGTSQLTAVSGATDPIQGWFSASYGIKVPNTVLSYKQTGTTAAFATLIASGPLAADPPQLVIDQNDTVIRLRVCAGSVHTAVEIDDLVGPSEKVLLTPDAGCLR